MSYSHLGEVRQDYIRARCATAVKALAKREFDARFFPSREEAVRAVLEAVPASDAVGCGGSWTVRQIGLLDALRERGGRVLVHEPDMDFAEAARVRREALLCPVYVASSNAITLRGELVNTDGMGNRVAGMCYGPATVIVVAGYNKLVPDLDAALERIREVAAPLNAMRYRAQVPCVERGTCSECAVPAGICRITTIIRQRPMTTDFKVFLVGESLGF